jgi:ElaB/YqjD/DUF883 family membrane-anchored ribosome-binding protein
MAANTATTPDTNDQGPPLRTRALDAARSANQTVRRTAGFVVERAPEAIERSQEALDEASRRVQGESKETVAFAAVFAAGLWLGLIVSRAPRLIASAAALPALVLAGAFMARRDVGRRGTDGGRRN